MKRIVTVVTSVLALAVVAASAASALVYAMTHGAETITNLGISTLSGIGVAVGSCIGGGLLLRFRMARRFIKSVLTDINEKEEPNERS
jgi:TRAP-type C4-dicarboxylate transport system permease small subunit